MKAICHLAAARFPYRKFDCALLVGALAFVLLTALPAQARHEGYNDAYPNKCTLVTPVNEYAPVVVGEEAPIHFHSASRQYGTDRVRLTGKAWRFTCPGRNKPGIVLYLEHRSELTGKSYEHPLIEVRQNQSLVGRMGMNLPGFVAERFGDHRLNMDWTPPTFFSGLLLFHAQGTYFLVPQPGIVFDETGPVTIVVRGTGGAIRLELPAVGEFDATRPQLPDSTPGLWSQPTEPGWGVSLDQNAQGITKAVWLTFDKEGRTTWFVMPSGRPIGNNLVEGQFYHPRGPAYAGAFDSSKLELGPAVGRFQIGRSADGKLIFDVRMSDGVSTRKVLEPMATKDTGGVPCNDANGGWWQPNYVGWGFGLQGSAFVPGCQLALTWATYDEQNRPVWFFSSLSMVGREMQGDAFQPRGSYFGQAADPAAFTLGNPVARLTLRNATAQLAQPKFQFVYRFGSIERTVPDVMRFTY